MVNKNFRNYRRGHFQAPLSDRELLSQLRCRVGRLERELSDLKLRLSETACNLVEFEVLAPRGQNLSFQPLHRGGSKKKTVYMIGEEDLIRIALDPSRSFGEPIRSALTQRVLDEL